jgi:hypothetical protein
VNRPRSWPASLAADSAPPLVVAATVTLDAGAAGGVAAQAAFSPTNNAFAPGTPWGSPSAYPAYVTGAHSLARLTATGGAGAALEFVVNGAVVSSFPVPGAIVTARARTLLSLTVLPPGSPPVLAALAAAGGTALPNMTAGATTNLTSSFVLAAAVGGAAPLLLVNVTGWMVAVGSAGIHMQLGRGGFANFSVSTGCPTASCSGLLPGQACVYAGGAAATCAPAAPTAASCGAASAASFVQATSSVGLPPTASPSPTPTPSSTPSTTPTLTSTPSTTSTLTASESAEGRSRRLSSLARLFN